MAVVQGTSGGRASEGGPDGRGNAAGQTVSNAIAAWIAEFASQAARRRRRAARARRRSITDAKRSIRELTERLADSQSQAEVLELELAEERRARKLAESELEVLALEVEMLVAWRQRALETLRAEAEIQRVRGQRGED